MLKVGFDVGGVISKYPDIFKALIRALLKAGVEIHIISDSPRAPQLLAWNGIHLGPGRVHVADYDKHGEACKGVLLEELDLDIFFDDFPSYVASGCPVRLLLMPDTTRPYDSPGWRTSEPTFP